jgi:hypothetical protein
MNKKQNETLIDAKSDIDKARNSISLILTKVQEVCNEIEAEYDELSEELQGEEEGSKLETEKTALDEALDALQGIDESFDDFDRAIETATEK